MFRMSLVLVVCAAIAVPALAEPITFTFDGTISTVNGALLAPFQDTQVGDLYELTYVFESLTPDVEPDPTIGTYHALSEFTVEIDGATQTWAVAFPTDMINVFPATNRYAANPGSLPVSALVIADFAPGKLPDDSLPLTLPWDTVTYTAFGFFNGGTAEGTISNWTPEPATLSLVALVAPFILRRR